jgi:starvation-inducible DNA-binding protein
MPTSTLSATTANSGLPAQATEEIAALLNGYLANLHVLYAKLHNFHWNIEGPSFYVLHQEIQKLYESVETEIDDVAERVLKIGRRPAASLGDYLKLATLEETESRGYRDTEVIDALIPDYQALVAELRTTIERAQRLGDEGTADDAIASLKAHEKTVWMLSAYRG